MGVVAVVGGTTKVFADGPCHVVHILPVENIPMFSTYCIT